MKEKNNCFYIISCSVDFVAKYTSFHNSHVFHLMRLLVIIFIYMWRVVELLPFMALRILCRTEAINNHFILHIFFRLLITRCCLLRIFQPNLHLSFNGYLLFACWPLCYIYDSSDVVLYEHTHWCFNSFLGIG